MIQTEKSTRNQHRKEQKNGIHVRNKKTLPTNKRHAQQEKENIQEQNANKRPHCCDKPKMEQQENRTTGIPTSTSSGEMI